MPLPKYWLGAITYDDSGSVVRRRNITGINNGMGYIAISPGGSRALFATERSGRAPSVDTYVADLRGAPRQRPLLRDTSALLGPCSLAGCTQVSTFHAAFAPDGKRVVFAYRAWTEFGTGVGSQALAISDADGSGVRPLTYDLGALDTQDMCPTFLTGMPDMVVFVRNLGPLAQYIALLNTTTGEVAWRTDWPEVGMSSGCPAPLGPSQPASFMYLGCTALGAPRAAPPRAAPLPRALRWGTTPGMLEALERPAPRGEPRATSRPCSQMRVSLGPGAHGVLERMFPIARVRSPSFIGVYGNSQCDRVWGADQPHNASIICEGADSEHDFLLKFDVSPTTGACGRKDTRALRCVMAPRPYALYRQDNAATPRSGYMV